jgi:hypothetical protein
MLTIMYDNESSGMNLGTRWTWALHCHSSYLQITVHDLEVVQVLQSLQNHMLHAVTWRDKNPLAGQNPEPEAQARITVM